MPHEPVVMGSRPVTWALGVGLLGVVLLALPLVPLTTTRSTVAYAAEQANLLDINTATAEQLKALPRMMKRATDFVKNVSSVELYGMALDIHLAPPW